MSRWITTLPPTRKRSYKHTLGPVLTQSTKMSDQCSQVLLITFNHNEFNAAVRSDSNSCEIRHFSYASLLREEHFLSSSPLKTAELAQSLASVHNAHPHNHHLLGLVVVCPSCAK